MMPIFPQNISLKTRLLIGLFVIGIIGIIIQAPHSYALSLLKSKFIDYTKGIDIKEGDFIFQHLPGPLTEMIADVTQSPYSHCGIIVKGKKRFFVLEAIGPVRLTPLHEWISRGVGQLFTIVRLKSPYQRYIPEMILSAKMYLGKPYDVQYEWDDQKIYCSELIQKAVLQAAGIRLADFVQLKDLHWQDYEEEIRNIAGGALPLEREMIIPEDIVRSTYVFKVYTSFRVRSFRGGRSS